MCDDVGKKMVEVILTASFMTTAEQRHNVPKLEEGVLFGFLLIKTLCSLFPLCEIKDLECLVFLDVENIYEKYV